MSVCVCVSEKERKHKEGKKKYMTTIDVGKIGFKAGKNIFPAELCRKCNRQLAILPIL